MAIEEGKKGKKGKEWRQPEKGQGDKLDSVAALLLTEDTRSRLKVLARRVHETEKTCIAPLHEQNSSARLFYVSISRWNEMFHKCHLAWNEPLNLGSY